MIVFIYLTKAFSSFYKISNKSYDKKFRDEKNSIKTKRFDAASGTLS